MVTDKSLQELIDELKLYKEKHGDVSMDAGDWLPFPFDEVIGIYEELLTLRQQNKALIEDAEWLAKEYLHAVQDIEGFAHDSGVDMKVTNSRETLTAHNALMQESEKIIK